MVKNKKLFYGILVITVLAIAGIGLLVYQNKHMTTEKINSFEECAKEGYPVLESYPRQCKIPNGKTFVEEVTPPKKLPKLKACEDLCGDGICQEVVCTAIGCPCAETPESCPKDCRQEKAEIIEPANFDMCLGNLPRNPDVKTAGIFLCKNTKGDQIYEVFYAAEDVGSDYFDLNRSFIARCGMFAEDLYPGKCREIREYKCNSEKDLRQDLCGNQ